MFNTFIHIHKDLFQNDKSREAAAEANPVFRKKFSFLSKSCFSIEMQCMELCSIHVPKDDNV